MKHKIIEFADWKAQVLEGLKSDWFMEDVEYDYDGLYERQKNIKKAVNEITYDDEVAKQMNKRLIVFSFKKGF